eukprot:3388383-Pleurochrysis_carterae.AAC.4
MTTTPTGWPMGWDVEPVEPPLLSSSVANFLLLALGVAMFTWLLRVLVVGMQLADLAAASRSMRVSVFRCAPAPRRADARWHGHAWFRRGARGVWGTVWWSWQPFAHAATSGVWGVGGGVEQGRILRRGCGALACSGCIFGHPSEDDGSGMFLTGVLGSFCKAVVTYAVNHVSSEVCKWSSVYFRE